MSTHRVGRSLRGFFNGTTVDRWFGWSSADGSGQKIVAFTLDLNSVGHFSALAFRRKTVPISIVGFAGKSVETMILPFSS